MTTGASGWSEFRNEPYRHFGYLESEFGFRLTSFVDEPRVNHSFGATYASEVIEIQITRDRGQVFVELRHGAGPWYEMDPLLERLGVPYSRFSSYPSGLWHGYSIENQSTDLRQHLAVLARHIATEQR